MSTPYQPAAPVARKWRMLLPLALVLVLAALWSGGWFYAAGKAESLIDAALAREAQRGRELTCGQKSVSGFPFRIVFDCSEPGLRIARGSVDAALQAAHLKAAVQIYRPSHIITELSGPLTFAAASGERGSAAWRLAQASVILSVDDLEQIDIAFDDLALNDPQAKPLALFKRAEAHARKAQGSATRDFDVAFLANTISIGGQLAQSAGQSLSAQRAELVGTVHAVPAGLDENTARNLRLWQQNGGKLDVARLWIETSEGAVLASGTLVLEDSGRPTGVLKAALANPLALLGGQQGGPVPLIMSAMQLLGKRVEIDGRKATEIDIALQDGQLRIGPATLGRLPPLY